MLMFLMLFDNIFLLLKRASLLIRRLCMAPQGLAQCLLPRWQQIRGHMFQAVSGEGGNASTPWT